MIDHPRLDIGSTWNYALYISTERLKYNKTKDHIESPGGVLEVVGTAGETAVRRYLGLPGWLHSHFDHGTDMIYNGWRIDVKSTEFKPGRPRTFLQWNIKKAVRCDLAVAVMVNVQAKLAEIVGFAYRNEVLSARVNWEREYPCHEIPYARLHPIQWLLSKDEFKTGPRSRRP